jgi:hypothetical protein
MSDKYIRLLEAYESEGYSYSEATQLAYEALNDEPYCDKEERQQALAEIAAEKQKEKKND